MSDKRDARLFCLKELKKLEYVYFEHIILNIFLILIIIKSIGGMFLMSTDAVRFGSRKHAGMPTRRF